VEVPWQTIAGLRARLLAAGHNPMCRVATRAVTPETEHPFVVLTVPSLVRAQNVQAKALNSVPWERGQ
jgi:hypothetical protein